MLLMMNKVNYYIYWRIIRLSRSNFLFKEAIDVSSYLFYKCFRNNKTFTFNGYKYSYLYHRYNRTVSGERIVEIPIARGILEEYKGKKIMEVGNVLSHYFPTNHTVLDKYEKGGRVINKDVVDYSEREKYDLIISISTMEHVGWDYGEKRDVRKFKKAVNKLKSNLKNGGMLIITLPLYYRKDLDNLILEHKTGFTKHYFLKRKNLWNE